MVIITYYNVVNSDIILHINTLSVFVCMCVPVGCFGKWRVGVLSKRCRTRAGRLQCCWQQHTLNWAQTDTKKRGGEERRGKGSTDRMLVIHTLHNSTTASKWGIPNNTALLHLWLSKLFWTIMTKSHMLKRNNTLVKIYLAQFHFRNQLKWRNFHENSANCFQFL